MHTRTRVVCIKYYIHKATASAAIPTTAHLSSRCTFVRVETGTGVCVRYSGDGERRRDRERGECGWAARYRSGFNAHRTPPSCCTRLTPSSTCALSFHRSFNPFIRPADHALRSASLSLCFSPSLLVVRGEGEKEEEEEERLFPLSFSPCPCLCTRRLLFLLLLLLLDQLRQRIEWNEEGGAAVRCFLHGGKGRKGDGLRMVRVER